MSKVLIDRALLETLLVQHVAELGYTNATAHYTQKALDAPSGTPAMPVKAYYHEAPNEYGGLNKSVGLEVRKEFTDAPLVLESDATAIIDGLRGELKQSYQQVNSECMDWAKEYERRKAAQAERDTLKSMLREFAVGISKREMPTEQELNSWFDRIDAALSAGKEGE